MDCISFIHLSDIHFRKTSGNPADIDTDLRDAIITDISANAKQKLSNIAAILVCGDIAFSGKESEYKHALEFLREITNLLSLDESDVFCVPGNHDVDQELTKSPFVYGSQCEIDKSESLDMADGVFEKKITDVCCNDILFKPIDKYNEFARHFGCDISPERIVWTHTYELKNDIKLCLCGMNSSFISNKDDHDGGQETRLMYVGQNQIPKMTKEIFNTVHMTLCHHPKNIWKFPEQIVEKFDKRADIQLFGHMHTQTVKCDNSNIVLYSGAVHPSRGENWIPRYNWIVIEPVKDKEKRQIKVKIYPRVLSGDRNCFQTDSQMCLGNEFIEQYLDFDQKRRSTICDSSRETEIREDNQKAHKEIAKNYREFVYRFFQLSFIEQTRILVELELMEQDYKDVPYEKIIHRIIEKAISRGVEDELVKKVTEKH